MAKWAPVDFREQSSFFPKPSDPIPDLMLTPTKSGVVEPKLNDFSLKALYCGPPVKTF